MKALIFSLTVILSFSSFASTKEIKTHMSEYLKAFKNHDEASIKKLSTDKYYNLLKKNNIIDLAFSKKGSHSKNEVSFDIKVKNGARDKDIIFVNIKDKKKKNFDDYWYVLKKVKNQYKIDDMISFD